MSQTGKYQKAIPLYRSALATRIKTLGGKHEDTLATKHNLASSLDELGLAREASRLNAQILKVREELLAADDYDLIANRHNLAKNHYALGKVELAAHLINQNLVALQETPTHDAQLLAIRELQDRVRSIVSNVKRALATSLEERAQSTTFKEPASVRSYQLNSTTQAFNFQAAHNREKGNKKEGNHRAKEGGSCSSGRSREFQIKGCAKDRNTETKS